MEDQLYLGILSGGSPYGEFYTEPVKDFLLENLRDCTKNGTLTPLDFNRKMPTRIIERFLAPRHVQSHGFRFFVMEGVRRRPVSGTFYYGGEVFTQSDLEKLAADQNSSPMDRRGCQRLVEFMRLSGWKRIIRTRCKNWLQFKDEDVLISLKRTDAPELLSIFD